MITKTVNLYSFDELSPKAKERAREWWREIEAQYFGAHGELYEPAETVAKMLGIEFKTHAVKLMDGGTRHEPNIWWQLHVQGSGAAFEATYRYAKGSVKAVKGEFPKNTKLHRIAEELATLQKKYKYQLSAGIDTNSREVHSYAMSLGWTEAGNKEVSEEDQETLLGLMRDFADWIFDFINADYDYRMEDDNVDESIRINEYTFTANGKRED
jgi:hypothetical protein